MGNAGYCTGVHCCIVWCPGRSSKRLSPTQQPRPSAAGADEQPPAAAEEEATAPEEQTALEEHPGAEDSPTEPEQPAVEEQAASEEQPAEEKQTVTQEEQPAAQEEHAPEELPAEEEQPAVEEPAGTASSAEVGAATDDGKAEELAATTSGQLASAADPVPTSDAAEEEQLQAGGELEPAAVGAQEQQGSTQGLPQEEQNEGEGHAAGAAAEEVSSGAEAPAAASPVVAAADLAMEAVAVKPADMQPEWQDQEQQLQGDAEQAAEVGVEADGPVVVEAAASEMPANPETVSMPAAVPASLDGQQGQQGDNNLPQLDAEAFAGGVEEEAGGNNTAALFSEPPELASAGLVSNAEAAVAAEAYGHVLERELSIKLLQLQEEQQLQEEREAAPGDSSGSPGSSEALPAVEEAPETELSPEPASAPPLLTPAEADSLPLSTDGDQAAKAVAPASGAAEPLLKWAPAPKKISPPARKPLAAPTPASASPAVLAGAGGIGASSKVGSPNAQPGPHSPTRQRMAPLPARTSPAAAAAAARSPPAAAAATKRSPQATRVPPLTRTAPTLSAAGECVYHSPEKESLPAVVAPDAFVPCKAW